MTRSKESVTQNGVITLGISDNNFCTKKIKCFKSSKHNTMPVRTYKDYSRKLPEEGLTKMKFPNYLLFVICHNYLSCVDTGYITIFLIFYRIP